VVSLATNGTTVAGVENRIEFDRINTPIEAVPLSWTVEDWRSSRGFYAM
jgi:hypothetical protein